MTIGDLVYLDARNTPLEERVLVRTRSKLDHQTLGPSQVTENLGHTVVIEIEGIPERMSADRIWLAPRRTLAEDTTPREETNRDHT